MFKKELDAAALGDNAGTFKLRGVKRDDVKRGMEPGQAPSTRHFSQEGAGFLVHLSKEEGGCHSLVRTGFNCSSELLTLPVL